MLARAGLGDDSLRPKLLCQQCLPEGVIDLVGTRMRQIFPLQPDLRTPTLREPRRERQRSRPTHPGPQFVRKPFLERRAVQMFAHTALKALQRRNESLGHIATAEGTETSLGVGKLACDGVGKQALRVG